MSEGESLGLWQRIAGQTAVADPRSRTLAWWGMLMLVLTEGALFAAMLSSYFFLRWQTEGGWPPDGLPDPKLLRPTVLTGVLVVSGITMVQAQRAAAHLRGTFLLLTLGFGATFLGLQIWDFAEKVKEFTPQTNAYGSLVYVIAGAHAVHVAAGLLLLGWITARRTETAVRVAALYWHFLVVLALLIWLTLYISPYV